MSLPKTIRRREQRKRRKAKLAYWREHPPRPFNLPNWMAEDIVQRLGDRLSVANLFNRDYR